MLRVIALVLHALTCTVRARAECNSTCFTFEMSKERRKLCWTKRETDQQTEQKRTKQFFRVWGEALWYSLVESLLCTCCTNSRSRFGKIGIGAHWDTLGRLQWPSCRAHSQVGPLSHRSLIQGNPRPHKKEFWLPVTQRSRLCGCCGRAGAHNHWRHLHQGKSQCSTSAC